MLKLNSVKCISPRVVQVEITTRCNLNCLNCVNMHIDKKVDMSYVTFYIILENINKSNLRKLILNGVGEPFINPDLAKILGYCKTLKIPEIELYTNATLINNEWIRLLEQGALSTIIFSLDGATKESFEKIRKGASFESVLFNISSLSYLKNINRKIHFVLSEENVDSLAFLPKLCLKLNIQSLEVVELIPFLMNATKISPNNFISRMPSHSKNLNKELDKLKQDCDKNRITLKLRIGWWKQQCSLPFSHLYINVEGDALPCCRIQEKKYMGNFLKNQFEFVWNSRSFLNWRLSMLDGPTPPECTHICNFKKVRDSFRTYLK